MPNTGAAAELAAQFMHAVSVLRSRTAYTAFERAARCRAYSTYPRAVPPKEHGVSAPGEGDVAGCAVLRWYSGSAAGDTCCAQGLRSFSKPSSAVLAVGDAGRRPTEVRLAPLYGGLVPVLPHTRQRNVRPGGGPTAARRDLVRVSCRAGRRTLTPMGLVPAVPQLAAGARRTGGAALRRRPSCACRPFTRPYGPLGPLPVEKLPGW